MEIYEFNAQLEKHECVNVWLQSILSSLVTAIILNLMIRYGDIAEVL